jgi:hypothetical protein
MVVYKDQNHIIQYKDLYDLIFETNQEHVLDKIVNYPAYKKDLQPGEYFSIDPGVGIEIQVGPDGKLHVIFHIGIVDKDYDIIDDAQCIVSLSLSQVVSFKYFGSID